MSNLKKYGLENKAFELELNEKKSHEDLDVEKSISNGIDKNANNAKLTQICSENEDDVCDEDLKCGLGGINPEWIQKFATKKSFMVVFALLGVVQGMSWSYFTATITTMQKRFKISSQTTGIVMTGNEISQIIFSLFLSYYGGKGHRPRWIAVGVLFSAIACFVLSSPHFFYGSGDDALSLTEEYGQRISSTIPGIKKGKITFCQALDGSKKDSCDSKDGNIVPLIIIFMSQFVAGIGVLLFFTLGGPYLDDNTQRKNLPVVFGITMSLRLIGPTFGYLIGSGTLKLYINPLLTPVISSDDPRWIGAWWLGWVIFGILMTILAFFIGLFPRRLRRQKGVVVHAKEPEESIPKLSEIPVAVKILLQNKINLFNSLAGVFYLFSAIGYWTYMPKYLETIFMQTASNASIISGLVGILCQSTGMLLSGVLISKFQPRARKLAIWNVIIAFLYVLVNISFTQLGCNTGKISFGEKNSQGDWNLTSTCNANCNCKASKILPVCYKETNTVFYSACHAGCTSYNNGSEAISNCSCLPTPEDTVTLGNCSDNCLNIFVLFLAINAIIKLLDASGRIGNMLISYRCVDLKDRSLSIGLNILLISLIAMLPSPIVFGAIIDSVCLVWGGSECGKKGNCMLYDGERLRYIFNLTAAAFTFIGGLFDCLVVYYVKDLELYKESDENPAIDKENQSKEIDKNVK